MIQTGWLAGAKHIASPHFNDRPDEQDVSLLVIHNISLPPGEFNNRHVEDFFLGKLDSKSHSYFAQIEKLKVSSHLYIKRDGEVVQFVAFNRRAWHAGQSIFKPTKNIYNNHNELIHAQNVARENCNNFSIGIELEGTDSLEFTDVQYQQLSQVTLKLFRYFPRLTQSAIVGHSDIAPGRKTDPGPYFNWQHYLNSLKS